MPEVLLGLAQGLEFDRVWCDSQWPPICHTALFSYKSKYLLMTVHGPHNTTCFGRPAMPGRLHINVGTPVSVYRFNAITSKSEGDHWLTTTQAELLPSLEHMHARNAANKQMAS